MAITIDHHNKHPTFISTITAINRCSNIHIDYHNKEPKLQSIITGKKIDGNHIHIDFFLHNDSAQLITKLVTDFFFNQCYFQIRAKCRMYNHWTFSHQLAIPRRENTYSFLMRHAPVRNVDTQFIPAYTPELTQLGIDDCHRTFQP